MVITAIRDIVNHRDRLCCTKTINRWTRFTICRWKIVFIKSLVFVTDHNPKKRSKKSTPSKTLTSLNSRGNAISTPPPILSTSGIPASTPSPTDTALLQHPLMTGNFVESDGHSSDSERKRKKARTTFTGRQIFELEKQFELKKYLSSSERSEMAKMLGVTETQVRL